MYSPTLSSGLRLGLGLEKRCLLGLNLGLGNFEA